MTLTSNKNYQQIWQTVQAIPKGYVASYGQIADLAGLPGRSRLVGRALKSTNNNTWRGQPIPWYRVVNSQGKISLPVASEEYQKQVTMLQEEQVVVLNGRINLKNFGWQPDLSELLFTLSF